MEKQLSLTIPAQIRHCEITIQADVINNDQALLINKDAMKKANCQIDLKKEINGHNTLHIIDYPICLCAATIVKYKHK